MFIRNVLPLFIVELRKGTVYSPSC